MRQDALNQDVKDIYSSILSKLYYALDLLNNDERENEDLISNQIQGSIDLVSTLMYSDTRC